MKNNYILHSKLATAAQPVLHPEGYILGIQFPVIWSSDYIFDLLFLTY